MLVQALLKDYLFSTHDLKATKNTTKLPLHCVPKYVEILKNVITQGQTVSDKQVNPEDK